MIVTGNRIWVVRWLSVLRISRYFHFLFFSALFPLTLVAAGPGLCTLDNGGLWLVTRSPAWPLIGHPASPITGYSALMHSNCCPGCPGPGPQCYEYLGRSLLTYEGFSHFISLLLELPLHSIDQHNLLHTDNVIVNYFYQPAEISRNKKVTQEGISFNIRPAQSLTGDYRPDMMIIRYKVANMNSCMSLCCLSSLMTGWAILAQTTAWRKETGAEEIFRSEGLFFWT